MQGQLQVVAVPVTLPVKFPEKPPDDVVTPVTVTPKPFACALTAPPNFKADASIPINSLPSPINFVAVTTPSAAECLPVHLSQS